jgi:hypothetical protein
LPINDRAERIDHREDCDLRRSHLAERSALTGLFAVVSADVFADADETTNNCFDNFAFFL